MRQTVIALGRLFWFESMTRVWKTKEVLTEQKVDLEWVQSRDQMDRDLGF